MTNRDNARTISRPHTHREDAENIERVAEKTIEHVRRIEAAYAFAGAEILRLLMAHYDRMITGIAARAAQNHEQVERNKRLPAGKQ